MSPPRGIGRVDELAGRRRRLDDHPRSQRDGQRGRSAHEQPSNRRDRDRTIEQPTRIVAQIEDITSDGLTVTMTLSAGNADFPFVMSDYHLPILPTSWETFRDGLFGALTVMVTPFVIFWFLNKIFPAFLKEEEAH